MQQQTFQPFSTTDFKTFLGVNINVPLHAFQVGPMAEEENGSPHTSQPNRPHRTFAPSLPASSGEAEKKRKAEEPAPEEPAAKEVKAAMADRSPSVCARNGATKAKKKDRSPLFRSVFMDGCFWGLMSLQHAAIQRG